MCHHSETLLGGRNGAIQLNAITRRRFGPVLFTRRRLVLMLIVSGGNRRSMQAVTGFPLNSSWKNNQSHHRCKSTEL
jgi:hypothetical protein